MRLLGVLADSPDGLSVAELASRLELGRTVVYRLLATLEINGYVRRTADGRCRLGMAAVGLSRGVQPLLRTAAGPVLAQLADSLGATAHLSLVEGEDVIVVVVVEPTTTDWYLGTRVGARAPLTSRATGSALLADTRSSRTTGTPREAPAYVLALEGGYDVAVPIREVPGLDAAVGVLTLNEPDPGVLGPALREAARAVADQLRS